MPGQIVILNGAPRSGKSSIAAAIQASFDGIWVNLGVDNWMGATPNRFLPGVGLRPGGERADLESAVASLYSGLFEAIAGASGTGLNVVSDLGMHHCYAGHFDPLRECAAHLKDLPVLLVGVRCPAATVIERRWQSGMDASIEKAERWDRAVHDPGIYDLEVDTSLMDPTECVAAILVRLEKGPSPSALATVAGWEPAPEGVNSDIDAH